MFCLDFPIRFQFVYLLKPVISSEEYSFLSFLVVVRISHEQLLIETVQNCINLFVKAISFVETKVFLNVDSNV